MAGIGGFIFSVHIEHIYVNIPSKLLTIAPNIAGDMTIRCMRLPNVPVKNENINEVVSGSQNWHASSIHTRGLMSKISKQSVMI